MTELEKIREIKDSLRVRAMSSETNDYDVGFNHGLYEALWVIDLYYPDELTDVVEQESPLNE